MKKKISKKKETNTSITKPIIIGTCLCGRNIEKIIIPYYEKKINEFENLRFEYIRKENNEFTSDTHNKLLIKIKEKYKNKIKGIVIIGSDDIIPDTLLKFYNDLGNNTFDSKKVYGVDKVYIYDVYLNDMYECKTDRYRTGIGRYYPYSLLRDCDYKLWQAGIMRGLDHSALETCKLYNYKEIINIEDGYVIDCKTDKNITPINRIVSPKDKLDSWGEIDHPLLSEVKKYFDTNIKIEDGCYYSVMIIDDRLGNVGGIIKMEGSTARALLAKNLIEVISKI